MPQLDIVVSEEEAKSFKDIRTFSVFPHSENSGFDHEMRRMAKRLIEEAVAEHREPSLKKVAATLSLFPARLVHTMETLGMADWFEELSGEKIDQETIEAASHPSFKGLYTQWAHSGRSIDKED